MPKYPEELRNVSVPPPGRWVWRDETTLELISSGPTEEGVLRKRKQTNVNFSDLQQRSEWLAEISTSNHRGRQSIRKSLSPAHLHAYRSFVLKNQGGRITTDDVKQVAVSLLQENYSLPIPFCFLAVLKTRQTRITNIRRRRIIITEPSEVQSDFPNTTVVSFPSPYEFSFTSFHDLMMFSIEVKEKWSKELDEVLAALLLYLSFFFEHNSLEKSSKSSMTVDLFTEHKMKAETLAKKEIVQKKLAVRYFSLIMDLDTPSYHKGWMSSNSTRWLLHACLYSFFCFVAWVTFGRKDLRDIQEEVGRLLYSDTFNTAVRNRTERDSGMAFASVNGSVKTGEADPKETGCSGAFKHRTSHRRPALSSIVNQRSPLMVCLLPSPKERSPHLFLGSRAGRQSPPQAKHCDTNALAEELNQQLANVSVGILGKSYRHFIRSTLIPYREQINNRDEDDDLEPESDGNNDSEDPPGVHVQQGTRSSFTGPKSRSLARYGSTTHANTGNSAATVEAVTSDN